MYFKVEDFTRYIDATFKKKSYSKSGDENSVVIKTENCLKVWQKKRVTKLENGWLENTQKECQELDVAVDAYSPKI